MRFGARAELAAAARRRDVLVGLCQGGLFAALTLTVAVLFVNKPQGKPEKTLTVATAPSQTAVADTARPTTIAERRLDLGQVRAPADVTRVAAWAVRATDTGDRPFAIVDKRRAQVYVFAAGGRLLGTSPVLLGYAAGDLSVAGIGAKAIEDIRPQERTTPAGRFESEPGRNTLGHDVVWVDYDAAVSMHRVRATNPKERRLERLASKTPADNRISWGCINVPADFFDRTVWPNLGKGRAIVYVLPEKRPLTAFFPDAEPQLFAQAGSRRGNTAKP